jgi:transposase
MDAGLPPKPSREELVEWLRRDPEAGADLVLMLWAKVEELAAEVAALKAKLAKDSHNSSKPPSSDRHNLGGPPVSRGKGARGKKRKPGGQPGRKGTTLRKVRRPDHRVDVPAPRR